MPRLLGPGFLTALAVATLLVLGAGHALASHVSCGDVITENTTLDSDLIDCPGDGIVIGADNITLDLDGYTVDAGPGTAPDDHGVDNSAGRVGVTIRDGRIQGFGYAAVKVGRSLTHCEPCNDPAPVTGNRLRNLTVSGAGIVIEESAGNEIVGNSLSGLRSSIGLRDSDQNRIEDNTIVHGGGMWLLQSDDNQLIRNLVSSDVLIDGGIELLYSAERNLVDGNSVSGAYMGIRLDEADANAVRRNLAHGNEYGIGVSGATMNRVDRNRIVRNAFAGMSLGVVRQTSIEGNVIVDNGFFGIGMNCSADVRVSRNLVSGTHFVSEDIFADNQGTGIFVGYSDRTVLQGNRVSRNESAGIEVAAKRPDGGACAGEGTVLTANAVDANSADGILVRGGPNDALLILNRAKRNGDDGIDVRTPGTALGRNAAFHNADFGIEAVTGAIDAGRNKAVGNGDPLQCLNVACR
jgi:parallel beta-helix repeat protein